MPPDPTSTICWQSQEAGYPHSYNLADGKWLYKFVKDEMDRLTLDWAWKDLQIAEQYVHMRRKMDKDGLDVVVWHVSLFKNRENSTTPFTCELC